MREENYSIPLDIDGAHMLRIIRRFGHSLEDFVIVYYYGEAVNLEIVRFDCQHGFAHRDLPYLPQGDKRRKLVLPAAPLERQYELALEDVRARWQWYFEESKRWRK